MPVKCTGITALVLLFTFFLKSLISRRKFLSTSQKTGFAPDAIIAQAVAIKELAGQIISSLELKFRDLNMNHFQQKQHV